MYSGKITSGFFISSLLQEIPPMIDKAAANEHNRRYLSKNL
jgi:hypothetical protein